MLRRATLILLLTCPGFAQLTFEVASIKPANPDTPGSSIQFMPGGGLKMTGIPLRAMITFAYDVRDFQISGGPGWMGTERFDVMARPEHAAAEGVEDSTQLPDLLQLGYVGFVDLRQGRVLCRVRAALVVAPCGVRLGASIRRLDWLMGNSGNQ